MLKLLARHRLLAHLRLVGTSITIAKFVEKMCLLVNSSLISDILRETAN